MKIIIRALTEQGKKGLAIHRQDELNLRAKINNMPYLQKKMLNKQTKIWLKTKSIFTEDKHIIENANYESEARKKVFVDGVKMAFIENGCNLNDFEVEFKDD